MYRPKLVTTKLPGVAPTGMPSRFDSQAGYTYDPSGNRLGSAVSVYSPTENKLVRQLTTAFVLDNLNRTLSIRQHGPTIYGRAVNFDYHADGRVKGMTRWSGSLANDMLGEPPVPTALMGTSVSVFHATTGRLESLTHYDNANKAEVEYALEYDTYNRIERYRESRGQAVDLNKQGFTAIDQRYTYDLTDQTTKAGNETFTFAANGNRNNGGYATDRDNRLATDPAYVYTYDAEGNRVSREALAVRNATQGGVQVVDNTPSTTGGSWTTTGAGYGGSQQVGTPTLNSRATASWQASTLPAGSYDVYATWSSIDNGLTSAPYTLTTTDGGITIQTITSAPVDFTKAPAGIGYGGANWRLIGQVNSSGTSTVTIALSTGTALFAGIAADAILFKPTGLDVARTTYEWDHQNRLTKVTNESATFSPSGAATLSPRDTTEYAHDVLGRRAAVTSSDSVNEKYFRRVAIYDGSQVVWTEQGRDREDMVAPARTQAMLWAPGTNELLVIQERIPGSDTIREPAWTLADHQGTVKDYLVKPPTTGAKSELLLTRRFSPFGTPLGARQWNVPTQSNPPTSAWQFTDFFGTVGFLYVGQEYDASTGLLFSRGRYYDPVSSEFISQDPLGFAGGDTNLYRRDGNQSVSARPRDRNWSEWAWESGAAAASTIGNALKLAVDPRSQLSAGYDLFFKDTATVWGNTAGMSTASRLGITAGFFVGDLTGLRGVDDFFHTHDAADGHVQSRTEQWFDGTLGAVGVVGTAFGAGAAVKAFQAIGRQGVAVTARAWARGIVDDVARLGDDLGRWASAPNSAVVDFAKAGAGANWKNIDQLKSYLRRHPVGGEYPQLITGKLADTFLTAKGKGAAFVIQPNGTFGIFIRTGATKREVLHEIGHLLTFEHVGSKAAYEQLGGAMREHLASLFVLTRQGSISRLTLSESALENAALLSNPTYSQTILDLLRKWGIKP